MTHSDLKLIKPATPPRIADVRELAVDAPPRARDVRALLFQSLFIRAQNRLFR